MQFSSAAIVDFYLFYDGSDELQIWTLLTRNQCWVSDTQVIINARGPLFYFQECKAWVKKFKYPAYDSINSTFNVKIFQFYVYYIFFGFRTCFVQIVDTTCNAWLNVTIACCSHTVKITFLIFSHCENYSLWRHNFYSMNKTRYFMTENLKETSNQP